MEEKLMLKEKYGQQIFILEDEINQLENLIV